MGAFDFLSPLATTLTQDVGAQQAGQTAANARVTNDALERAKLMMQMRNQQQEQDFRQRTLANTAAETNYRVGGQPTPVGGVSPSAAMAATMGPGLASATAPTAAPAPVGMAPALPGAIQEENNRARNQLMLENTNRTAMQALETGRENATAKKASDADLRKRQGDYGVLKDEFPKHPAALRPFDPNYDYTGAVADQRDRRKLGVTQEGDWAPSGSVDQHTGEPILYNKKTGDRKTMTGALPNPKGGPGGGGGGIGAQAPLDDMLDRYDEIAAHAADVKAGKFNITRAYQTREGVEYGIARGNAAGQQTPFKSMAVAEAQDILPSALGGVDAKDPQYQRYQALMNSQRALGDDVAKVFKGRQNEDAVLREIALAQLAPGDYKNETVVNQKLDRLRNVIKLAALTNPQQTAATDQTRLKRITGLSGAAPNGRGGGGGRASGAPTQLSADQKSLAKSDPGFAAHLQSLGYTAKDWQ